MIMGKSKNIRETKFKDNLLYIKELAVDALKEINPWTNIKIMHTNISQDIMAGIVVAIVALPGVGLWRRVWTRGYNRYMGSYCRWNYQGYLVVQ